LHPRSLQRAVEQLAEQECLLVGDVLRQGDAELRSPALDAGGDGVDGVRPGGPGAGDRGGAQTLRIVDVRVVEAPSVADPALVDLVVLVRCDPHQLVAPLPLRHAAAHGAFRADGLGVRHVPRPRLEAPHARREGADWAEVDDVAAEDRLQRLVELARDERLHAALVGRQLLLPRDLVVVARAAIAEDAALAVERDLVRKGDLLLEVKSRAVDAAGRVAMPEGEVLQGAFAALVTYRAVERMIGELELEDVSARLNRHGAQRLHDHSLRDGRGACGLGARRSWCHLDQALAAGPDRVELVVVAEDRDLDPYGLGGLDYERPGGSGDLVAVDGPVDVRHQSSPLA